MIDHEDGVLQGYDLADGRSQQIRWDPCGDKASNGAKKEPLEVRIDSWNI